MLQFAIGAAIILRHVLVFLSVLMQNLKIPAVELLDLRPRVQSSEVVCVARLA